MKVINKPPSEKALGLQRIAWQEFLARQLEIVDEPEDELPKCPSCDGLGVIRYNVPITDKRFGKLFPCTQCKTHEAQLEARANVLELPTQFDAPCNRSQSEYAKYTVANWANGLTKLEYVGKSDPHRAAQLFVSNIGYYISGKNSLVFHGPNGTGKTSLAAAIANTLTLAGKTVAYRRAKDMVADVNGDYNINDVSQRTMLPRYKGRFPVILDEMDMNHITDNRLDIFEDVIRYRCENHLPTVITTNLDSPGFPQFRKTWGSRTHESLVEMAHWVYVGGERLREQSA